MNIPLTYTWYTKEKATADYASEREKIRIRASLVEEVFSRILERDDWPEGYTVDYTISTVDVQIELSPTSPDISAGEVMEMVKFCRHLGGPMEIEFSTYNGYFIYATMKETASFTIVKDDAEGGTLAIPVLFTINECNATRPECSIESYETTVTKYRTNCKGDES